WQPVDSLLWAKTMGLWLSDNWRVELSRQALAGQVPQHLIDELWPSEGGGHPDASLPAATRFAQVAQRLMAVLPRFPGPFTFQIQLPTNGRWTDGTPQRARRCWRAIRISRSVSRASGTSPESRLPAMSWWVPPRPGCRSWC